jgi:hypothetical protein
MIKKLLSVFVILVVLLLVGIGLTWWYIDSITKEAIQRGGRRALGVETRVETVDLSLLGGTLNVRGLQLDNPQGFETPYLMSMGNMDSAVDTGSVMSETVEITRLELSDVEVYIEQKGRTNNIQALMEQIKKLSGPQEDKPADDQPGKKVKLSRVVVRNVTAHVKFIPVPGELATVKVKVPEIVLEDITPENAGGVAVKEVVARLVPVILASVLENARDLPVDLVTDLKGAVAGLGTVISDQAGPVLAQVNQGLGAIVTAAGGVLDPNKAAELLEGLGDVGGRILDPNKAGELLRGIGEGSGKVLDPNRNLKGVEDGARAIGEGAGRLLRGLTDPNAGQ